MITFAYLEIIIVSAAILVMGLFSTRVFEWPQWKRLLSMGTMVVLIISAISIFVHRDNQQPVVWVNNVRLWTQTPLKMRWDKKSFNDYESSFQQAIKIVNRDVGCPVLAEAKPNDLVDINILSYDMAPCGALDNPDHFDDKATVANTFLCMDGTAQIQIMRLDELRASFPIVVHELGHVFGFAHMPGTIMSAGDVSQLEPEQVGFSIPMQRALRERYCRPSL